jgi:hypothetical protein
MSSMRSLEEELGAKKTPEQVLSDLVERDLTPALQRIAALYHVTLLEVCANGRELPVPKARLAMWTYLMTPPPEGPGWSKVRIAEAWGLDPTTVGKVFQRQRAALKKSEEK